jgi:hypothetical protein
MEFVGWQLAIFYEMTHDTILMVLHSGRDFLVHQITQNIEHRLPAGEAFADHNTLAVGREHLGKGINHWDDCRAIELPGKRHRPNLDIQPIPQGIGSHI